MSKFRLGRVQMEIMRVLWKKKRATARDITDALNKEKPIAHSSVQTLLRTLEKKGVIDHEIDDRTFVFYPLVMDEKVTQNALKDFIDHIFAGSPVNLVSFLVKREQLTPGELEKIRKIIEPKEK